MKISDILKITADRLRKADIDTANLDARLLLCKYLNKDKLYLIVNANEEIEVDSAFDELVERREKYEPMQYILGKAEFYGLDFKVNKNEIVGLVGKNGAGKSTIIKSVTGVLPFDSGKITIAGFDVVVDSINAKKHLGYVPDVCNAFDKMTGMEYLNFVADIFGVNKKTREEKLKDFQKHFSLGESIHKLISSYSHGMRQKISIMASLMSSPKLWILDEPTTGLDPLTTSNLLKYIDAYAKSGNAVMFSSHNLDVVKRVCDRVIIIKKGNLIEELSIEELKCKTEEEIESYFTE